MTKLNKSGVVRHAHENAYAIHRDDNNFNVAIYEYLPFSRSNVWIADVSKSASPSRQHITYVWCWLLITFYFGSHKMLLN